MLTTFKVGRCTSRSDGMTIDLSDESKARRRWAVSKAEEKT